MKKTIGLSLMGFLMILVVAGLLACVTTGSIKTGETKVSALPKGWPEHWKETEICKEVKLPDEVNIVPPDPKLPEQITAWSGRREGRWSFGLANVLIVEEVGPKEMKVIYSWGPTRRDSGGWERRKAEVLGGGKKLYLYFPGHIPLIVVYEMKDGIVRGSATQGGRTSHIVMKKIED